MYDRETGSLWSQLIGQSVEGHFEGAELNIMPSVQTTWDLWVSANPRSLVMDRGDRREADPYRRYYADSSTGIHGETRRDDRLDAKALVLGVTVAGTSKAYPFAVLDRTPIVNDVFNKVPLLVTFDRSSDTASVFSPTLRGDRLTFSVVNGALRLSMRDAETGSLWDPLTGVALEGPLAGTRLERVASHYEFWFAWKDYRPETELYLGEEMPVDSG